jgi:hypothetical protein
MVLLYTSPATGIHTHTRLTAPGNPWNVDAWPDLTDPATLGCLLALVREAWGDPSMHCAPDLESGWWTLWGIKHDERAPTEAAALVAALEAAP